MTQQDLKNLLIQALVSEVRIKEGQPAHLLDDLLDKTGVRLDSYAFKEVVQEANIRIANGT